jgi:hypothetical protein
MAYPSIYPTGTTIYEVTWDKDIVWEWVYSNHFESFGFREDAKNCLSRDPNMRPCGGGMGDWMHINSLSLLGPNQWYDSGDQRFHPDNIIVGGRETNIIFIISKATGEVVWKVGPYDYIPQLDPPKEVDIAPPLDVTFYRVPGASPKGPVSEISVEGVHPYQTSSALCVISDTDNR